MNLQINNLCVRWACSSQVEQLKGFLFLEPLAHLIITYTETHDDGHCSSVAASVKNPVQTARWVPEMEGVRTPSPMTQQVPMSATASSRCCMNRLRSRNSFSRAARFADRVGRSSWYVDRLRSSGAWLVARLIFAYRQISEYSANFPPARHTRAHQFYSTPEAVNIHSKRRNGHIFSIPDARLCDNMI